MSEKRRVRSDINARKYKENGFDNLRKKYAEFDSVFYQSFIK